MCLARCFVALILLGTSAGLACHAGTGEPPPETEDTRPVGFPAGETDSGARGRYFRVRTTAEPSTLEAEELFVFTVRITAAEVPQRPPRRLDLADIPGFAER